MTSEQTPSGNHRPLYPQVLQSNPELHSPFLSTPNPSRSPVYPSLQDHPQPPAYTTSSSSSMYPSTEMKDLAENLFPDGVEDHDAKAAGADNPAVQIPVEETLIRIPGAILHLIDKQKSVEIGSGECSIVRLRQGENVVAVLVIVDTVQWPLTKDEAAVRLDDSHYFFSLRVPGGSDHDGENGDSASGDGADNVLNYGLTFASKGQEALLKELDAILEHYSSFSVQKVVERVPSEVLDTTVEKETAPSEVMKDGSKKEIMEERSAAYWTTLAPNVEDYSNSISRVIAKGSGQVIKGIVWCGDVTVDRLKWGNDLLKKRMEPSKKPSQVSPQALRRMKRVKAVTKMSENVVTGVLSGVIKVSGFFTSSVVNSKAGKKFFRLLPGEIVLASLDGFAKICDAVEVVGKNVLSTSSTVTTGLVSHRYGEQAGEATKHGVGAAGHAIGTAWAVFKIRKALNPKGAIKPTTIAKSAAKAAVTQLSKR